MLHDSDETVSLHDQLSDANVITTGLPDGAFLLDDDAFPDDTLTDEDLIFLADREQPLIELLKKSIETETEKRRLITVPAGLLRDVLELRQLERNIANWQKFTGDDREEFRYRAEQIEKSIRNMLGEDRRTA